RADVHRAALAERPPARRPAQPRRRGAEHDAGRRRHDHRGRACARARRAGRLGARPARRQARPARDAPGGDVLHPLPRDVHVGAVLRRLLIENLVLIRRAELELAPGLNAITGETGAGKTILAQAVGLLLGGRGDAAAVGPDGAEAYVEAELDVPAAFFDAAEVEGLSLEDEQALRDERERLRHGAELAQAAAAAAEALAPEDGDGAAGLTAAAERAVAPLERLAPELARAGDELRDAELQLR